MKVLILAAGKGLRLKPLTLNKPKSLIEVAGKPFLYFLIKNLNNAGFNKIGIVVGHKKEMIRNFVDNIDIDDLHIQLIEQTEQLGTGHAIQKTKEWSDGKNFLVVMGDNLYSSKDISKLDIDDNFGYVSGFKHQHPEKFGVLLHKDNILEKIVEKPKHFIGDFINTGLYKFTPEIFSALDNIKKTERGEYEITDAINLLCLQKRFRVTETEDYWINLGSKENLPIITEFIRTSII